ncbi:MAG TPA: SDR family NAD(P)-dependent oxidoreductase, partial [Acidimicrobiales bacterium]|nr:SDR family NAD(P)-dependent oxidoreductase [Acidimicrobiales bacterium]
MEDVESRSLSLRDKVIVITGAASGMGRASARQCAALGAAVVVADINCEGAGAVAQEIETAGGTALAHGADLTIEDDVNGLVDVAVERFGTVHVLHNNAYGVHPGAGVDLIDTSLEAWDWTIRTCLTSQFLCCRAVLPHMLRNGHGSIINVSSGNGFAGSGTSAAYGTAKAGTAVLTKYIAT